MKQLLNWKAVAMLLACSLIFGAIALYAAEKPKSVIHVVTVKWKPEATPEQIKAALDGVETVAKEYPGVTRTWTRTIKVQGGMKNVIVMEFESEKALADYANSAAQKKWYEVYLPIREQSITHDVTN
jgi:antibiotic biosynthesis monooxygenase (ABM) superfamily enzyme